MLFFKEANRLLTDWLYCSREQQKQDTGDSSATQIPPSTTSNQNHSAKPDLIYGNIQQSTPVARIDDLYANTPSKNDSEDSGTVIYSEVQRKDGDDHVVAPSGDLYAQVRKR